MIVERIIEFSVRRKWVVFDAVLMLAAWAVDSVRRTPLDALPDLSDPQVILFTEWMGRSPDLIEDQITYPLVRALQSTPGIKTVRGYSMFGMSFTYAIFKDGTDIYWARTRVLEQLGRVQQLLPPDVSPTLGPDARVITLRPRDAWPTHFTARWYSTWAPDWTKGALHTIWPEQQARTLTTLSHDLDAALRMPGYQMAIAPPIRTRIDMLSTGVRTPVGVKVFGADLKEIERISVELEGMLREVPGTRSTFAERQTGREYIDIVPNREMIARYGLTVRDVQDVVEAAVGGMPVSVAIAGRARFSINVRYAADQRSDPEALLRILVPVQSTGSVIDFGSGNAGAGASTPGAGMSTSGAGASGAGAASGGMGAMGGGSAGATSSTASPASAAPPMAGTTAAQDFLERWRQPGAAVPLGQLADIQVTTGPPMIKDENGILVGYVFADIDQNARDLGGWVADAKALVASRMALPAGYRMQWTGQYEFLAEMEARLRYVIPLTLVLVVVLLFLALQGWPQTFLVLASLPFAVAGSVWLLAFMHYNLSTAVWVGLIAVAGVAAETGIVMVVYLDEAFARYTSEGRIKTPDDVDAAVIDGAATRVRPLLMTVATTVLGLLPLLWESGVGADVSARTAAPVVGGLLACTILTLLVLPAAYTIWRRHQVRVVASLPSPTTTAAVPILAVGT